VKALSLLIVFAIACSSRSSDPDLGMSATQAMIDLETADATFPKQLTSALTELEAHLITGTTGAADAIKDKILPLVDGYLATIDRAITKSDAYLASIDDETSRQALERVRTRAEAFRKARARLAELEQKARAGASGDELNKGLFGIGLMLSVGK
jgi:hypothetical protein